MSPSLRGSVDVSVIGQTFSQIGHVDLTKGELYIHSRGHADLASGEWPTMLMFLRLVALGRHSPKLVMLI
jgi:hypothetical protein